MNLDKKCSMGSQVDNFLAGMNPHKLVNFSEIGYRSMLIAQDRIQCSNRYIWQKMKKFCPLSSQLIESFIYDSGAVCCWYENDILTWSHFAENGKIGTYGMLESIQPITLDGKKRGNRRRVITGMGEYAETDNVAIIVQDYTGCIQQGQIIPRLAHNSRTTISDQVKTYKLLLYDIIMSIKKLVAKCENEEQVKSIMKQAEVLLDPTQPIVGLAVGNDLTDKFELLNFVDKVNIDQFIAIIDFYYKIRRGFNGIPAPDVFEKKERMITSETESSQIHTDITLLDGLNQRKYACELMSKYWGLDIDVTISDALGGAIDGENDGGNGENTGSETNKFIQ